MAYKNRDKYLASQKKYNEAHREERRLLSKKWKMDNPEKVKAHNKKYSHGSGKKYSDLSLEQKKKVIARHHLQGSVRAGRIKKQPCFCGELKVQAHHNDYPKTLQVVWLCRKHHEELHHNN